GRGHPTGYRLRRGEPAEGGQTASALVVRHPVRPDDHRLAASARRIPQRNTFSREPPASAFALAGGSRVNEPPKGSRRLQKNLKLLPLGPHYLTWNGNAVPGGREHGARIPEYRVGLLAQSGRRAPGEQPE